MMLSIIKKLKFGLCLFGLILLNSNVIAKDLTIVTHTPSGGYFISSKLVSDFLPRYLPDTTVKIKVVPGASGVVAANYLYEVAPRDGSTIGTLYNVYILHSILEKHLVKYDPAKFTYLGSTIDGRKEPMMLWSRIAGTNVLGSESSLPFSYASLLKKMIGLDVKEVRGYSDGVMQRNAFEKREIDLFFNSLGGMKLVSKPLLNDSTVRPILQFGNGSIRHPDYLDAPTVMELLTDDNAKRALQAIENQVLLARLFAAPPGILEQEAKTLRDAIWNVLHDDDYIMANKKLGLDVSAVDHETIESAVKYIMENQDVVLEYLR